MDINLIRYAEVIDNVDPDKKGKVKVKIFPELKDVNDDLLPLAEPYLAGIGSNENEGLHKVPEIGQKIRVIIEDEYWRRIFYISGAYVEGQYIYENFENDFRTNISELGTQEEPQPNYFEQFKDGSIQFRNTETGEVGFYHNKGSYVIFDVDGNLIVNTKFNKVTIKNSNTNLYEDVLKKILDVMQKMLTGQLSSPAGPVVPLSPDMVVDIVTAIQKLGLLMK